MRRIRTLLLLALVCSLLTSGAAARAQEMSPVRDSAGVLSLGVQEDARDLIRRVNDRTDIQILVETRHFLGGSDAQSYAQGLLGEAEAPEHSLLLLMVIGEESYALAAGDSADRLLNREARDSLLSSSFRGYFLQRDYDRALASFLTRAGDQLAAAAGERLKRDDLFEGLEQGVPRGATATPQPRLRRIDLTQLDNSIISNPISPTQDPTDARERAKRQDKGLSFGSVVVIGFVLYLVFGKKNKKSNKDGCGCGCGPLGWIFGALGLSRLFGWRK
jgi:uncharacterized membrane protein YgcG